MGGGLGNNRRLIYRVNEWVVIGKPSLYSLLS